MILVLVLAVLPGYVEKWLWMRQLDYATSSGRFCRFAGGCFSRLSSSLFSSSGSISVRPPETSADFDSGGQAENAGVLSRSNVDAAKRAQFLAKPLMVDIALASAAAALFFGGRLLCRMGHFLRFRYGASFGVSDPLFGVDVGFYVFHLPFYELLQNSLMLLTALTLTLVLMIYLFFGSTPVEQRRKNRSKPGRLQASVRPSVHLGRRLGMGLLPRSLRTALLHSGRRLRGRLYGLSCDAAGPVDDGRRLSGGLRYPRLQFLSAELENLHRGRRRLCGAVAHRHAWCFPSASKNSSCNRTNWRSRPLSEAFDRFTRKSYELDAIQETSYPALADLTRDVIARNQDTIQNVRLWDARPLLQTYQQTQAIRLYYQFYNVDTDRYQLADGYHQVMLSARELSTELPAKAQTWVNQYLQFTHGNGAVMNFVSKTVGDGFPQYLLENVPADPTSA